jgi:hypothetical protein
LQLPQAAPNIDPCRLPPLQQKLAMSIESYKSPPFSTAC